MEGWSLRLTLSDAMTTLNGFEKLNSAPGQSPYLSAAEAAHYIRSTIRGIYQLVYRGLLTPCPGTRKLLFTKEELDLYLTTPRSRRKRIPISRKQVVQPPIETERRVYQFWKD
jgi:hypothetical protein